MAAYMRNPDWKNDEGLKEKLDEYSRQGLQRSEILSFMKKDFGNYAWSLRTLDRRMREFGIYRTDRTVTEEALRSAVEEELDGPGKLLGYRAMANKIRQEHNLKVPRRIVHAMMYDVDPHGLEERAFSNRKKPRVKGRFTTAGSNWVHSLDGHAKLMGFQKDTFPLAVYGCLDTASRKLLFLKVGPGNSDPRVVGLWYLEFLYETKKIASKIRIDKGTETGKMATLHAYLRSQHNDMDPLDTVMFGKSTSNQIERWWRELHERLEKYYKEKLSYLKECGYYNPDNERDRFVLAYLFIPILQQELDNFRETVWNTHRIRKQKDTYLPDGVPNRIYEFPEEYGLEDCSWPVMDEQLKEAAIQSGLLCYEEKYIPEDVKARCQELIPCPLDVQPKQCVDAFLYLKEGL